MIVGALKFPVGPSIKGVIEALLSSFIIKELIFLPLKITISDALSKSAPASVSPSFLLAEISSAILIEFASRNLDALVQVVHPFRK